MVFCNTKKSWTYLEDLFNKAFFLRNIRVIKLEKVKKFQWNTEYFDKKKCKAPNIIARWNSNQKMKNIPIQTKTNV